MLKPFLAKYYLQILLVLLTIPAVFFLLRPGEYWNMHDDMQIIRQLQMEKCLADSQIPCRWTPDLGYGYGYPLFNFYPPLPYIVGEVFRFLGFSLVATVKLTAILHFLLSAWGMYLLAAMIFGPMGGFLASLFYTYAPYRDLNIYVRGAVNEAWASVFFPFIFYFSAKLINSTKNNLKYFLFLSLSICGLLLSHNPMVLTFAPLVAVWVLYWIIRRQYKWTKLWPLFFSGLLALGLSAYFTLPVLFESKLVSIESMFINYYHYSVHFTSLYQLFISPFWSDGPSVWGPNDGMSFMLGYLHWIVPLILILYSAFLLFRRRHRRVALLTIILSLLGFFAGFMTHQRSSFLWELLPPIQKIQFPWRFLNHASFLLSLSAGALGYYLGFIKTKIKWNLILTLVVSLILIGLNWSHLTPITHGPITDAQKLSGQAWNNQITSGIYDYLPKTASTAAKAPAKLAIDEVSPADVKYQITGLKSGTDWLLFNLDLKENASITLSRLGFPGFQLFDRGQPIKYQIEPVLGRIKVDLSAGSHQLYLKLYNTPIRTFSNILSLFCWLFWLWKLITLKK